MSEWLDFYDNNRVHKTAQLHHDIVLGKNNIIHAGVIIDFYSDPRSGFIGPCMIGDNNTIHKNVRIMCDDFEMGDGCVLHNHVFIDGKDVDVRDNVWVGQYSHIDGYEFVIIHNDVTIGYNCYLWTHAGRAGIEPAHEPRPIVLKSGVWLMGANVVVNPGVTMAEGSRALSNSVVTKDTEPGKIYGGVPARPIE